MIGPIALDQRGVLVDTDGALLDLHANAVEAANPW